MKNLININFYRRIYIQEEDTIIYNLDIKNKFFDINIKIINSPNSESKRNIELEITSKGVTQYYLETNREIGVFQIAEEFIFANNLAIYIDGFGLPAFNKEVYLTQNKPTTFYEERIYRD
jgi:hypothetical protein